MFSSFFTAADLNASTGTNDTFQIVCRILFVSETGKNWALNYKKADQSKSYNNLDVTEPATNAVDGNTDGIFDHHSCSYAVHYPRVGTFWRVLFGNKRLIQVDGVVITTRADCCGEL